MLFLGATSVSGSFQVGRSSYRTITKASPPDTASESSRKAVRDTGSETGEPSLAQLTLDEHTRLHHDIATSRSSDALAEIEQQHRTKRVLGTTRRATDEPHA